ncbi:MAG: RNA-binding protein [Phycisphaerales bacterium]|nr:RNA-binding protein [Hyphomonadaceae bacterium]
MPKGPKGEKRPADAIGNAVKSMRILTGDEPEDIDTPESQGKDPHASAMGKKGAAARAAATTPEQRKAIAKKAAAKRWKKKS